MKNADAIQAEINALPRILANGGAVEVVHPAYAEKAFRLMLQRDRLLRNAR